jgi:tRNA-Thr(GGU) m(6)t(6)A37 methyltransferase TsaA
LIPLKPIGYVRNNAGRLSHDQWRDVVSQLVIYPRYQDGLYRIGDYSHIYVLFHLHEQKEEFVSRIHPRGNSEYPQTGAFSTRTPNRPSRIGLTIVPILDVQENIVTVRGLDAYNNSPLLDIKPYYPRDFKNLELPEWVKEIHRKRGSRD